MFYNILGKHKTSYKPENIIPDFKQKTKKKKKPKMPQPNNLFANWFLKDLTYPNTCAPFASMPSPRASPAPAIIPPQGHPAIQGTRLGRLDWQNLHCVLCAVHCALWSLSRCAEPVATKTELSFLLSAASVKVWMQEKLKFLAVLDKCGRYCVLIHGLVDYLAR